MELYTEVSYQNSKHLTLSYSTSFGMSSRLFSKSIRQHIYAIYGLVRIADEIVDTYHGQQSLELLKELESDTYRAISIGYSANPIVHAFALTARDYQIDKTLIAPFFASMAMDLKPATYNERLYGQYIYGSAEVIGLMCLQVFCGQDKALYQQLSEGAKKLGAAYQKINFLRDIKADYHELGRLYFPGVKFDSFNDSQKAAIIKDIRSDFEQASDYINKLPRSSQAAVRASYDYYSKLLIKIEAVSIADLKANRIRISDLAKISLLTVNLIRSRVKR